MLGALVSLLVAQSGFFLQHFPDRPFGRMMGRLADNVLTVQITSSEDEGSGDVDVDDDSATDEDADEVLPPVPPVPPAPPVPGQRVRRGNSEAPRFTEKSKNVPTAEVLHRIAQSAGWSMTLVGSPKEKIDVDLKDADPREALRQVLKSSGAMGVLK